MREFPQDLVDLVLDRVADACSDNTNLAACGGVCRRWMPRSRMYFFSRVHIPLFRADPTTIQAFLDIVDTSLVDVLSFVQSLDLALIETEGPEPEYHDVTPADRLCQPLLATQIRRFGACPSLTRFELKLPGDIGLHTVSNIVSALPLLTHLRIGGGDYTIVQSETPPVKDMFPPHLRNLDLSVDARGASLFFGWLLSHSTPPTFTSLVLVGDAMGRSIAPIESYLRSYGSTIETSLFDYWADYYGRTETIKTIFLASTPRLLNLTLKYQCPKIIPTTLALIASVHLVDLHIEVRPPMYGRPDWPRIDEVLAARFPSLKRLCFEMYKTTLADIKPLMPQVGGILEVKEQPKIPSVFEADASTVLQPYSSSSKTLRELLKRGKSV
ncbi:hypothetical protein B0H16DRAFT_1885531, partial [Mycena metata]